MNITNEYVCLGNIDQNQYVEKVRIIMDFIAPRILKEDIETIWKMQVVYRDVSYESVRRRVLKYR